MTNNDGKVSAATLIGIGLATLAFAGVVLYAGYRFALRDVCAQNDRYSIAALAAIIASVISIIFFIWGAVRGRAWRTTLAAVASSLASLGLIAFAAFLFLALSMSESGAEVSVSEDNGLHISVAEGFRVRSLRVEGTGGRWSIKAIDEMRPPLSQNVARYTLGQTPAGYDEQESTIKLDGALPDGEYRVEAIITCPYGPARASFTIKQGKLHSSGF
ncbi:MAG TPA: hypothetical protein VF131_28275 [Blastocatellia bacterium]|nr:hypothetical protein [Blastocatellia bacterium]